MSNAISSCRLVRMMVRMIGFVFVKHAPCFQINFSPSWSSDTQGSLHFCLIDLFVYSQIPVSVERVFLVILTTSIVESAESIPSG